jgi:hypothetical protein
MAINRSFCLLIFVAGALLPFFYGLLLFEMGSGRGRIRTDP